LSSQVGRSARGEGDNSAAMVMMGIVSEVRETEALALWFQLRS